MKFSRLTEYLNYMVETVGTPGVDCLVYRDHEPIYRYFTGMRDIEAQKPTDGNELYIIFSMTKMLTVTAALQLYEKGCYLLDDPVPKYLPEFSKMKLAEAVSDAASGADIQSSRATSEKGVTQEAGYAKNPITIKHLLTMSAGLGYNIRANAIKKAVAEGRTSTRELVAAIAEIPPGV